MLNSNDLVDKVKTYNTFVNPKTLTKAYDFAVKAHEKREFGDFTYFSGFMPKK